MGFTHIFKGDTSSAENGVLIASKVPGEVIAFTDPNAPYAGNVVCVDLGLFNVIGGYFPHKKHHTLFDQIIDKTKAGFGPAIIAGDFNTGFNHIDQRGNSFWYQDQLRGMKDLGLLDAWRYKHGDLEEYSWYSHQGNGFRYDHTWISGSLQSIIKDCYYLHTWRESGWSDHSAMMVELG